MIHFWSRWALHILRPSLHSNTQTDSFSEAFTIPSFLSSILPHTEAICLLAESSIPQNPLHFGFYSDRSSNSSKKLLSCKRQVCLKMWVKSATTSSFVSKLWHDLYFSFFNDYCSSGMGEMSELEGTLMFLLGCNSDRNTTKAEHLSQKNIDSILIYNTVKQDYLIINAAYNTY